MEKSDLNGSMLFKLRDRGLCVLLDRHDTGKQVLYGKEDIMRGSIAGMCAIDGYNENLSATGNCFYDKFYDIIAIKQYESCPQVLHMVMNNEEPEDWDWVEEVKEEKVEPEVQNTVQNFTINITIDPHVNIDDFVRQLSSKLSNIPRTCY